MANKMSPELDVENLERSLDFYTKIIGFQFLYARPEERFVFLDLDGAQIMLEEAAGPGRHFRTAALEPPFGRGMNLQIEVADASELYRMIEAASCEIIIPLEERWYRLNDCTEGGNRQFVVADPAA